MKKSNGKSGKYSRKPKISTTTILLVVLIATLLAAWTLIVPLYSEAVVFWPGLSRGSTGRNFTSADLPGLRQQPLMTENVNVNGQAMTLEIYQLNTSRDILVRSLKNRFKIDKFESGRDFLRVVQNNGKNNFERWLFVFAGEKHPVTAFRLEQNGKLLKPAKWPAELPALPSGARPNMVMELPRLDSIYGSFDQSDAVPEQLLASYSARLASAGWQYAGAEHAPSIRGTGEIYFKNQPSRQILWIKFGSDGSGSFYVKKLK